MRYKSAKAFKVGMVSEPGTNPAVPAVSSPRLHGITQSGRGPIQTPGLAQRIKVRARLELQSGEHQHQCCGIQVSRLGKLRTHKRVDRSLFASTGHAWWGKREATARVTGTMGLRSTTALR